MTCFLRTASQAIPGCASGGAGDVSGDDYCFQDGKVTRVFIGHVWLFLCSGCAGVFSLMMAALFSRWRYFHIQGGALYLYKGAHKVSTSVFTRNRASVLAASRDMFLTSGAHLSVYQSNFPDNQREDFAAVFYCQKGYSLTFNQTTCQACAAGFYSSLGYNTSTLGGVRSLRSRPLYMSHLCISLGG